MSAFPGDIPGKPMREHFESEANYFRRIGHNPELAQIEKQRARLFDCLNRFVRAEDETLTAFGLVSVVFERWAEDSNVHLGDPADGVILEKEA